MSGEINLKLLLKEMEPFLNEGTYVFVSVESLNEVNREDVICEFREQEGTTIIIKKEAADKLNLQYHFIASWITLKVHSSLHAVGLTAAFSSELAKENISCNVVAGYYHDHIFVAKKDEIRAINVLKTLANNY